MSTAQIFMPSLRFPQLPWKVYTPMVTSPSTFLLLWHFSLIYILLHCRASLLAPFAYPQEEHGAPVKGMIITGGGGMLHYSTEEQISTNTHYCPVIFILENSPSVYLSQ